MEDGEEGLRSRLTNLREQLTRVSADLERHSGTLPRKNSETGLVPVEVTAQSRLLSDVEKSDKALGRVYRDLRDALAELAELDLKPARRRQEAARLYERLRSAPFPRTADRDVIGEIKETFTYASSPLLQAGDGLFFQATQLFLERYARHTAAVRSLHDQTRDRCETLTAFAQEALEGPVLKPPVEMSLDEADELHHRAFEQLVADLLHRDGFRIVRSGGGAGDQGADVIAVDQFGRRIMLQAKHFRKGQGSVGQPVVQHLYGGAVAEHQATLPVVVTNGRFTAAAKVWAAERDRVRLVDREGLRRWAQEGVPLADVISPSG
ncbi:restriction endonuclease [Streptomyces roseoviridis]|uniref:Restriction endonuclease n=1 Tax=Streptomyces roseoviridis TaxID=67361 RepID=A0ABV5QY38_9ACTN